MNDLEAAMNKSGNETESKVQPNTAYPANGSDYLEPAMHSLRKFRAQAEVQAISRALEQTGWNRKRTAKLLSISYRGLLYKIRQHNITRDVATQMVPLVDRDHIKLAE
jgi:DNA-binding NtrC family response regulator